jgi:hypothetical protein
MGAYVCHAFMARSAYPLFSENGSSHKVFKSLLLLPLRVGEMHNVDTLLILLLTNRPVNINKKINFTLLVTISIINKQAIHFFFKYASYTSED